MVGQLQYQVPQAGGDMFLGRMDYAHSRHHVDDPARAVAEAAKAVTASGRLLIIDLGPHEVEQLRSEHAHRRLGFSHEQVAQWIGAAGLTITAVRDLKPKARLKHALSVTLWSALDRRIRLAGGLASGGDPA